jgi:transglycosylase-like protein with SLT domain
MKWNSYEGGTKWARLPSGEIISERRDSLNMLLSLKKCGGYLFRTVGDPTTAHTALQDFGGALEKVSKRFDVPVYVLFAMMAIEATKQKRDRSHFDPRCCREEPGYTSDEKTPHRVSPGLMQTLITTARGENKRRELYLDIDGELEDLTREDLFIPERSIMLGASYMRHQIDRKESDEIGFDDDDPILLCSAYNAGSVRPTSKNDFHLLTYGGNSRIEKFIAFNNDMISVLSD